ncbi:MAG: glycine cleavage system aminomethyltransferase GcvT [Aquiluna sp.]|nr:glycine cleavage system aminomethyltransferase GcvT [Aquiluna sp.]MCF8545596.1 glycine cleavage system aminomethyltransferase GcvT [Aquiluna sp.]
MLETALADEHKKLGASFTDFGGWNMPVRYGSDLDEHHAVRNYAGLFDISHMGEIRIKGDAANSLDFALISKLSELKIGKAKYTMICNEQGGIIDDLIGYRMAEDEYLIVANAGNREVVFRELSARTKGFDVTVTDESQDWSLIAIQGPMAAEILQQQVDIDLAQIKYYAIDAASLSGISVLLARTGYTGEDGFEVFVSNDQAAKVWNLLLESDTQLVPCGLACRDTLRLEAGMPLYGHELSLETTPCDVNLGRVVRHDKGESFSGSALGLLKDSTPKKLLFGIRGEGRRAARADYEIFVAGAETTIGTVTSGALSPTLGYPIAMAMLDGSLGLEIGSKLEADVRGTKVPYEVVELPFYKRGK